MNDRYLFRGKRLNNERWVYGGYYCWNDAAYIIQKDVWDTINNFADMIEIDPSTLGQCTGLQDKNGKSIFEGDIIKFDKSQGAVIWGNENCFNKDMANHSDGWLINWQGKDNCNRMDLGFWAYRGGMEVIGNVHDSPELLEKGA